MKIDISKEKERFSNFLNEEDNKNIIFSGIYGIGKTYFINNFFEGNETYIPLYITPINYSVSSNEDIFEYIKFDILFQLLGKDIPFEEYLSSWENATILYMKKNIAPFILDLMKFAEKIKYGINIFDNIEKLYKGIKDTKEKEENNEERKALTFLKELSIKTGTIYEDNAITQIIRSSITYLKDVENEKKKIVLVVDDLDRIDPEHIFRILNVLSAHNDFYQTEENKFSFDKVILVCDIENIKKIFNSKYGKNVDFNGYIDKFYSKEIYYFNNIQNINNAIPYIIENLESDETRPIGFNSEDYLSYSALRYILSAFLKNGDISTRKLLNLNKKYIILDRRIWIGGSYKRIDTYQGLGIFEFLKSLFSTIEDLSVAINHLNENNLAHR